MPNDRPFRPDARPIRVRSGLPTAALLVAVLWTPASWARPSTSEPPPDALAPTASGEHAEIRQLHTVTICTTDLEASLRFYRDALGLEVTGPHPLDDEHRRIQRGLWTIPEDVGWKTYLLRRADTSGAVQIRLLVLDRETPSIHRSFDSREPGPFSLGFPTDDLETWDPAIRAHGFGSLNVLEAYDVPRPDGTRYPIQETIFNGPDFVHAVGISRGDGMRQLGPLDGTGRGGPAYSAQSVRRSDEVLRFYTDILGLELRSDRTWKSAGSRGALNVPDGTTFRFSIVYAPGAATGHLLFIDFGDAALAETGIPPRPPYRGLGMWSFPVRDVERAADRLRAAGVVIVDGPKRYTSPSLGDHRAVTVLAPNGFLVELFDGGPGRPFGDARATAGPAP